MKKLFCAALFFAASQVALATPTQLIQNGDFENHWVGWTPGSDQTSPYQSFIDPQTTDIMNSNTGAPAWGLHTGPYGAGQSVGSGHAAYNGLDGSPGSFSLFQSFQVTSAVSSATLSFDWGFQAGYSGLSRSLELNIYTPSGGGNVFSYVVPFSSNWQTFSQSIDITSLLNQGFGTYSFGLYEHIPQNYTGPALFGIDNISILAQVPEARLKSLLDAL